MAMIDDLMRSASLHQNCTLFCSTNQRGRVNQYGLQWPYSTWTQYKGWSHQVIPASGALLKSHNKRVTLCW